METKTNEKKKILVLASTFPRWKNDSTPPFVLELEKRLVPDFDITVLAPHYKGAKKHEEVDGLKVHRFQYFWPASLQKLCYNGGILPNLKKNRLLYFQALTLILFQLIAAAKIINNEKIAVVHAHWILPQGVVALMLKKMFKTKYIATTHGGDIYGLQGGMMLQLKKMVLENADKITVVSSAIKIEIEKKINPKLVIDVIPMGVDSKMFNPNKYDASLKKKFQIEGPFLLFVGRLAENKGVQYLLQAMPGIIDKFPNVKLLIIGEGPLEKDLKSITKDLGIQKNIIFVGAIPYPELPKFYATADLFIGPSVTTTQGGSEGLGLTLVEASFSGCIPIGTNVGGISDVIKDNKTGFLVKEKNSNDIAEKVIKILKDSALTSRIKKEAKEENIKKFDWKFIANKYKSTYESNF